MLNVSWVRTQSSSRTWTAGRPGHVSARRNGMRVEYLKKSFKKKLSKKTVSLREGSLRVVESWCGSVWFWQSWPAFRVHPKPRGQSTANSREHNAPPVLVFGSLGTWHTYVRGSLGSSCFGHHSRKLQRALPTGQLRHIPRSPSDRVTYLMPRTRLFGIRAARLPLPGLGIL